jgi:hypothetical protein
MLSAQLRRIPLLPRLSAAASLGRRASPPPRHTAAASLRVTPDRCENQPFPDAEPDLLRMTSLAPSARREPGMAQCRTDGDLNLERRKEIFLALVEAQDQPMSVVQSRKPVGERFDLDDRQMRQIEEEGLEKEWPLL